MADISKIKLPDGVTYNFVDSTGRKEANLEWGGKNFTGSYGCIDAAMIDPLGANRFFGIKASAITIEYSRDTGATWTDYGASDGQKQGLFVQGNNFLIGKADSTNKATANGEKYQLRITINTGVASIYTVLNKIVIYVSTNGSNACKVKIQKALQSTPTTFVDHTDFIDISGWSGYNVLNISGLTTYGNTASSQYGRVRFIFKANGGNTNYNGLNVQRIMGFGGVGWNVPSIMAGTGHLYAVNEYLDASFPAQITATKFNGTATTATTASYSNYPNIVAGNEIRFNVNTKPSSATDLHIGYAWSDGTKDAKINSYRFENGNMALTKVYASEFNGALVGNVTGNCSGSSGSCTGNAATATSATTASKLGSSNVGSATNPIYLNGGTATACTYSLNKTVPSDAVFTDTNNAVTQTEISSASSYEVLLSGTADHTTRTESANKSYRLVFAPALSNGTAIGYTFNDGTRGDWTTDQICGLLDIAGNGSKNIRLCGDGTIAAEKIICHSMYTYDISSQYTFSKSSGNWTISAIAAHRTGNVVNLAVTFKGNGSAVSAGGNGFVGTCTAGPLPLMVARGISFLSSGGIVFQLDIAGNVYARVIGSSVTLASTGTNTISTVFMMND